MNANDIPFRGLSAGFINSAQRFPERPALEVASKTLTYKALFDNASSLAASIQSLRLTAEVPLTAVLAHRSTTAFTGIIGALLAGHGYVPLNPFFPVARTAEMLQRSDAKSMIVGQEAMDCLHELLPQVPKDCAVILPDINDCGELRKNFPEHSFVDASEFQASEAWVEPDTEPDSVAYLLFTSGSTGHPKGVPITHRNIRHFIDTVTERYEIDENDRLSQMFELVFDLSIFDIFAAFECGACICCPSREEAQIPARYVNDSKITVWFSVPSLALHMKQMRMLKANVFPTLRLSLFCGEALLSDVVEAWAVAAQNSAIENVYGPTEVTLACTAYRWDPASSPAECDQGLVPIGGPFTGLDFIVVDEHFRSVTAGDNGELLMCGPQVAPGYWNDENKTREAFVSVAGKDETFYRTGDLVRMPNDGEPIKYLGRLDHQIKIRGNRVELGEVEAVIRDAAGVELAVAVGWPQTSSGADAITAFLEADANAVSIDILRERLADRLPLHMMPKQLKFIDKMPLNANGKVDRNALIQTLEDDSSRPRDTDSSISMAPNNDKSMNRGIVILGCPRSGTTLLRKLLDSHPNIACPGETCVLSGAARFLRSEVVSDGLEFGVLNGLAFAGFKPQETLDRLRKFTFSFHNDYARMQGKTRWAEKTAVDVFYLSEIEELCADHVQYICVVRHGLDVACSIREFSDRGHTYLAELHEYVREYPRPLEAFAHAWVDATESLLDFQARHADNALVVSYESLIRDPDVEGNRLFKFLGEEWQESIPQQALGNSDSHGMGDWKASSSTSINTGSINRWRSLPPGVITRLAEICNPTLKRCGYEPIRLQPKQDQAEARRRYNLALSLGSGKTE
jgi:amino acid adenylation domain-containing protein